MRTDEDRARDSARKRSSRAAHQLATLPSSEPSALQPASPHPDPDVRLPVDGPYSDEEFTENVPGCSHWPAARSSTPPQAVTAQIALTVRRTGNGTSFANLPFHLLDLTSLRVALISHAVERRNARKLDALRELDSPAATSYRPDRPAPRIWCPCLSGRTTKVLAMQMPP